MTTPLALHPGAAHDLLVAVLAAWVAVEVLLRLRNLGSRAAVDWTFPVVVAAVTAGFFLSFRAAHLRWAVIGGGWAPVAVGLFVAVLGIAFRVWAMLTLGRLFTFVVAIQDHHSVVDRGPYRLLRHPSYTGALAALLGIGIALDSWLAAAAIFLIPFAAVLVRIRVEEARLGAALGPAYQRYAARTHRLVPGVW
jgi:protein-S-isoprenylcysteine O-methyltransferase Ste14